MFEDFKPVTFMAPRELPEVEVYPLHDIHYGNELFDAEKWKRAKTEILAAPNRYCILLGDMLECVIAGVSKGDAYKQMHDPHEQLVWLAQQLDELRDRVLMVIPGNHENRILTYAGLDIVQCACAKAGIEERYRHIFGLCVLSVGVREKNRQTKYSLFGIHRATDQKRFCSADTIQNVDAFLYGHDHDPKDHPRSVLYYDPANDMITQRNVEVLDCGSFIPTFGGYGARSGYRPTSNKSYKLVLHQGKQKKIETVGFYF